ncbi:Putative cytochrome P450 136 [Sinobacterium norvegicum]|uniref:Cytochrome P450 136 n=1 Tax=Sinobacterium norvegicum TaxID=1641715 RepID=A0ABM9AES4_9GAMM|nr:cytochrome P450 [Sinobacterium norvegicum]CAH0991706.1 Putative cytochrome P450 136 [Sinobacterium norvegicum]
MNASVKPDYQSAKNNTKLKHIPGHYGLPVLGNTIDLFKNLHLMTVERWQQYGAISRGQMGREKGLIALGPDIAKEILIDRDKNFSSRMGYDRSLVPFFGLGLLMHDFDEHRFQRRILQTGFKTPAMRGYVELMNPVLEQGIKSWKMDKDFRFYPEIKKLLLRMALKVFYGVEESLDQSSALSKAFLDCTEGQLGLYQVDMPGFKFHTGMKGSRYLRDYILKLIPSRREGDGKDMLSFMCKETKPDGSLFSDDEILDHAGFLLFAAHDTTTSTLTHMMYYLAKQPEWQQRLREEGQAFDKNFLDYEDLGQLEQLDWVFNESQRLHPSVMVMARRTISDCVLAGHKVPANTMIFQFPMFTNRMEEYWTRPGEFEPDRFGDDRAEQKNHPFCFMPFGGGAHKCIGMHFAAMQAKLFTHQFLRHCEFKLPDNHVAEFQTVPLPKLKDDLPLLAV